MSSVLVVAEKPSVARDIAQVLGARTRGDGMFSGNGWIVTWAIGHLVALAEPHEMNPDWKRWRLSDLPLLPKAWPLVVTYNTRAQFAVVKKLLRSQDVRGVVCATDAGREGELIFRYIYEAAGAKKPVKRLWISSLTPDAISAGFKALKEGRELDRVADAARARSRADWLVGMNLSRLYSVLHDANFSVGRVQTPTLAMIVERELEIRSFVPQDYLEVVATFGNTDAARADKYDGTYLRPNIREPDTKRLPPDGEEAKKIIERAKRGTAQIESVDRQIRRLQPPQLYDLTELQRHANRLYGFTAQRTLQIAQTLYEQRKLISYPRTDSRYVSKTVEATFSAISSAVTPRYDPALIASGTGTRPLSTRFVDDSRVSDHHAILPTQTRAPDDLPSDEKKIYDLICWRFLTSWHGDHVFAVTTVITAIRDGEIVDRYSSSGTSIEVEGWKVLDIKLGPAKSSSSKPDEPTLPGGLAKGMARKVLEAKAIPKKTRPPPRLTDATLLTAMETAGRTLDEKEMSEAMRERGLGTPATRASILETLLKREYIVRDGKMLSATDKGIGLIAIVHAHVKSPAMTGEWEAKLGRIERGEEQLDTFMEAIEAYVREVVGTVASSKASLPEIPRRLGGTEAELARRSERAAEVPHEARSATATATATAIAKPSRSQPSRSPSSPSQPSLFDAAVSSPVAQARSPSPSPSRPLGPLLLRAPNAPAAAREPQPRASAKTNGHRELDVHDAPSPSGRPTRSRDLRELLSSAFGFASFRPYQEDVCVAAASGKDVLLVMPTGAGKSLCYQLPGIARGGTTLVVSPLIALMEDQVAQLCRRGLAAERIHSGRTRLDSRAVCRAYLDGVLDFLFIAPERLKVPGFPEMLARRRPTLIAIDEAHCISQWGHDFRPDYRMLGQRLPLLRPAPVIALTATATPTVQDDIIAELRLDAPMRSIHGFRRTNIAVEVVARNPSERPRVVKTLLEDPARRPAIVYAPTRSEAERLADDLASSSLRAAAYHAGMSAGVRDSVQSAFLGGKLDVIIATTAFGMGIDKADVRTVIHTALPASVEGYYQEIGRAGRDGKPSRAILLHSFVDTKTHEFFLERDYPPVDVLEKIEKAIVKRGDSPDAVSTIALVSKRARVPAETFEKALEKLWIHGGAIVGSDDTIRRGHANWREAYEKQREHKRDQLARMRRYAETPSCRMLQLVAHFGDENDSTLACGICDICASTLCVAQTFRAANASEIEACTRILEALHERDGRAVGQIHRDLFGEDAPRRVLEELLTALVRAGLVRVIHDEFIKDGERISFQRVWLARPDVATSLDGVALRVAIVPEPSSSRGRGKAGKGRGRGARGRGTTKRGAAGTKKKRAAASALASTGSALERDLRAWRTNEAKRRGIPAFRVLTDQTLLGIAAAAPTSEAGLLAVSGIGMSHVRNYGGALLQIIANERARSSR